MVMDVVAWAHESRDARELGARVLEGLRATVGIDVGFIAAAGVSVHALPYDHVERALGDARYERELSPVKSAAIAARGVATDAKILGRRRFATRWFRDLAAPIGGRHTLLAYTRTRGAVTGVVMLGRCSDSEFRAEDVQRIESVLPTLSLAFAAFGATPTPVRLAPIPLFAKPRAGDLVVRDRGAHREMLAGELVWTRARRDDASRSGWPYVDLLALGAVLARERTRALVVGCGGGALVHLLGRLFPAMTIDVVERDARVVELARRWFALRADVRVADGGDVIAHAPRASWDAIFVDAYDASADRPAVDAASVFVHAKRALRPGGAIAFNVIGDLAGGGVAREVTDAALRCFQDVRVVPVIDPGEVVLAQARRNVVVIARDQT